MSLGLIIPLIVWLANTVADDAPRSRAWMTKYARDPSDERPSVSRYARAHGLPWPEAKKQMEETKCST